MPQFATYEAPEFEDSDTYKPKEHYDATLVVKVKEFKSGVITEYSPEGGDAVIVDVLDVDAAETFRNVLWMGGAVVDGLKKHAGTSDLVVIHFEQRTGKSGRKYPAVAAAATSELKAAEKYFASHDDPFAAQFTTVSADEPPF